MAEAFGRAGASVAIGYVRGDADAKKTQSAVESAGGRAMTVRADVRSSSEVNAMVRSVLDAWGRIDVLIHNAGSVANRLAAKMTDEEWREPIAVSLDGLFYCSRAVIPAMRAQKGGVILGISSYGALRGFRGAANYAAAKAGVIAFLKSLAVEEGPNNIRANAVVPGFHVTDMNRETFARFEEQIRGLHLLKEMPKREELAEFVVHVAGLASVTGQVFAFESRLL